MYQEALGEGEELQHRQQHQESQQQHQLVLGRPINPVVHDIVIENNNLKASSQNLMPSQSHHITIGGAVSI